MLLALCALVYEFTDLDVLIVEKEIPRLALRAGL